MRNRRAITLFGLAILFAAGAAFTARHALESRTAVAAPAALETVDVLVARIDLEAGAAVRGEQIQSVAWPADFVPAGTFQQSGALEGRVLRRPVAAGEPVLSSALMPEGTAAGLVSVIDKDRRAVSVKVDQVVGVAGFVTPGARVDVLATLRRLDRKNNRPYSRVILQDVAVLAIDQQMESVRNGDPELVSVVTLAVSPADAQKLIYSAHEGQLQLALRSPGDHEIVSTRSVSAADLLRDPRRKSNGKPRNYVQVLNGSTVTVKSF